MANPVEVKENLELKHEVKQCTDCNKLLAKSEFYRKQPRKNEGYTYSRQCKECYRTKALDRWHNNPNFKGFNNRISNMFYSLTSDQKRDIANMLDMKVPKTIVAKKYGLDYNKLVIFVHRGYPIK